MVKIKVDQLIKNITHRNVKFDGALCTFYKCIFMILIIIFTLVFAKIMGNVCVIMASIIVV